MLILMNSILSKGGCAYDCLGAPGTVYDKSGKSHSDLYSPSIWNQREDRGSRQSINLQPNSESTLAAKWMT